MKLEQQFRLNSYLAIFFGLSLIIVETIRRFGEWGHWSWWIDDYIMGIFLIISALLILNGNIYGRSLIIAAWGFNSGLLYGSFFSKITDNKYNFQSNIEPSLLITLIGLGFITATLSLLWVLIIQKKSIKIGSTELKEIK